MTSIRESIRRRFQPVEPLPSGMYSYQAPPEDPRNYRYHLRIEQDGSGLLIVNASTVLHLSQTATEYAYHLVQGDSQEDTLQQIGKRYRVSREQAAADYADFVNRIERLATTTDLDPATYLEFDRQKPYAQEISAPYRLDCAITYRLAEGQEPTAAPTDRVTRELTTQEWEQILDKAWAAGIPHVLFTGGEPLLRDDLIHLITYAEAKGQVTGVLTGGLGLLDPGYLQALLQTGLDHLLFLLEAENPNSWDALARVLPDDLFTTVHITMTAENQPRVAQWLQRLADLGVKSLSLSGASGDLADELLAARQLAASLNLSLVWDLPVPYSGLNPFALEFVDRERPSGAGRAWLYVEPDGDVLPGQGSNQVLGNLLNDPWEPIWQNARDMTD